MPASPFKPEVPTPPSHKQMMKAIKPPPDKEPEVTNGNDLPEHRQRQFEAGLAYHQKIQAERDEFEAKLAEAIKEIAGFKVRIESLLGIVNMMEDTIKGYRADRDNAVRFTAKAQAVIENIHAITQSSITEKQDEDLQDNVDDNSARPAVPDA